jgi:isopenicillin N synthase-like dioxygenase
VVGPFYAGWVPGGAEANAAAYGEVSAPDLKETFAAGGVDPPPALVAAAPRFYGESIWPVEVPELRSLQERFVRAATALTDELLVLLAMGLDAAPDALLKYCRSPIVTTSLNWYPSRSTLGVPVEPDQYRIGPHTDYGTVTVLDRQPGLGGLEVFVDGEWETAPWVEGSLTVNTGMCMQRWSNHRWTANRHRVLAPPVDAPDEELVSLVYFHDPQYDTVIEPLPGCVDADHPPRYEPVLAGEHLGALLDAIAVPT